MHFDVFSIMDKGWENALGIIPSSNCDIYYLPQWYDSWSQYESATPRCIYFEMDGYHFLYPFFQKQITNYNLNNNYYDIQSAYGYGGVIVNNNVIPEKVKSKFNELVDTWLNDNHVVAEFVRDHPLLNQFQRKAIYNKVRQNVYIETESDYRIPDKQARQNVSKAISCGVQYFYDPSMKDLNQFINLYSLTAHRLNMSGYYHFNDQYFRRVSEVLLSYATLIHIAYKDKYISSGMYFKYGEKATLHLLGSNIEYQNLRANDLLYHAAIQLSINNGAKVLSVGGGTTIDPDDPLFRFKSKFSKNYKDVMVGKNVINKDVYKYLITEWERMHPQLIEKYSNYFLKYHIIY